MIRVQNLKKSFGRITAVNGISFTVEKGEVLGFLGPNGAGKSTTMRMITGFIPPSAGEVSVGGFNMLENPIPRETSDRLSAGKRAVLHGHDGAWISRFAAELRGLRGDAERSARSIARSRCVFSNPVLHQSIETLSKGYRHRTCFAQAIIHDPEVLIMDEPTDGLDPNQKHEVRTLIREMGENESDHFFDAHSRGSGSGLLARDHHRSRPDRGERHARRIETSLATRGRSDAAIARRRRLNG